MERDGAFTDSVIKQLGALPLVLGVIRDLGIREVVDHFCPIREEVSDYSHGQMIEILLANRLTAPHPLYAFEEWAEVFAVGELFRVEPGKLNDDRLGRTLDALSERIDEVQVAVAKRAVEHFGLDLGQAHIDATSFFFEGAYQHNNPDHPQPARGYNAQRDFKRKQLRTGQAVLRDGNVPIFHKAFDGNRTDTTTLRQVYEGLQFLRSAAKPKEMIHVGDSKLLAAGNLLFLLQEGVLFVAPGERRKDFFEELARLDPDAWQELDYVSESEAKKRKKAPPEEWNRYWCQEVEASVRDPKSGEEFKFRKFIIRSSEEARAAKKNRDRQMAKAEQELEKLRNGIPRYYKTEERVRRKVEKILESRRVEALYQLEIGTRDGTPFVNWTRDEEAIEDAERISGCYPLLTNLPAEHGADEILKIQKDQYRVEHRFADWKGPIAVCPMFLKSNQRIAALVAITAMALTVFCLIERQVRRQLGDDQGYAVGFYPENRKSRPTGNKIFNAVRNVQAIVKAGELRIIQIANVSPLVRQVHAALGVDLADFVNA